MKIGYVRVYTGNDTRAYQESVLVKYMCDEVLIEQASAHKDSQRPIFEKMFKNLKEDDVLIVTGLNVIMRSMNHLLEMIHRLEAMNVRFISVEEKIDTGVSSGKTFTEYCQIIKTLELKLQSERTAYSHVFRRPSNRLGRTGITTKAQQKAQKAVELYKDASKTVNEICDELEITRATFYRYLRHMGIVVAGRA